MTAVFAVEDTAVQLVTSAGPVVHEGLTPGTEHDFDGVSVRTFEALPGPELFRFATIGDLHIGDGWTFGVLPTITSEHRDIVVRCVRAAIDEARAWGAQLLVVKGDITHHSRPDEWALARQLLAGGPVIGTIGNHDVKAGPLRHDHGLELAVEGVLVRDEPGVRIIVVDATIPRRHPGSLRPVKTAVLDAAAGTTSPVVVTVHHQLHRTPFPNHWPPGIMAPGSTRFLRELAAANRRAVVTSGHTHRCRARRAGPVLVTEVGSVKDHPGAWAGYVVHEGGIRQVVRRTMDPDVFRWTEATKRALFGIWGRWSPGALQDRCVRHAWAP